MPNRRAHNADYVQKALAGSGKNEWAGVGVSVPPSGHISHLIFGGVPTMKAAAIFAALIVLALAPSALAQQVGQYDVYLLPSRGDGAHPRALIVDTKNGYVWEWEETTGLKWQGQATPGQDSRPFDALKQPEQR